MKVEIVCPRHSCRGVHRKGENMKFEYVVELERGYVPVMAEEEETEVRFVIEAKNRVTADRAVRAMLEYADNVEEWSGICIE